MKIIHFIQSLDVTTGGPARSVTNLLAALVKYPDDTFLLFTYKSTNPIQLGAELQNKIYFVENISCLRERIVSNLRPGTIFHSHGIWQWSNHKMITTAHRRNIPYIISPRGMLEPWSLSQKKLKKNFALLLYQKKDIKNCSVIHATSHMEALNIRKIGFTNPIAVIPNGIDLVNFPKMPPFKRIHKKKILFLSRIHKKKGIENLLDAWVRLPKSLTSEYDLDIVGNGDELYIHSLRQKIIVLGLGNAVNIKEPVFGEDKIKIYRDASIFILPSFSENFGMVIAEALASFTPVITTKGTPWQDLEIYNCGWWIDLGVEPLVSVLKEALSLDPEALLQMGSRGHDLIAKKYSIDKVARDMQLLYSWVANKIEKPDFII